MGNQQGKERKVRTVAPAEWRTIIGQTYRDLLRCNALEWSATLAFYAFLSMFPLLLGSMVILSYVADAAWITDRTTTLLGQFVPDGQNDIEQIVVAAIEDRRRAGILSIVILLVAGRRFLGALTKGLNLVSDVDEQGDPIRRRVAVELSLFVGLMVMILLNLASRTMIDAAWQTLQVLPGSDGGALTVVQAFVHVGLLLAVFTLIYLVVPRGKRHLRPAFAGALLATTLFLMAEGIFRLVHDLLWESLVLQYGLLASAALLLSWSWYVGLITLAGGAFASHTKTMALQQEAPEQVGKEHTGR